MTEPLLYSAEPVIEVDGQVRGEVTRDLLRLEVTEDTEGLKTLVLRLAATPPHPDMPDVPELYLNGSVIDFGKQLTVAIGPSGGARTIFRGSISAIEASYAEGKEPEVVVFAEDKLMQLRMTRRVRTYENKTDAQIAEEIAGEHGLSPDTDADGPTYDVVQQWNQSDLAFLRERADLIQAEVWLEEDRLCFKSRASRSGTEITLVQGNQLLEVQLRADLAHQRTTVHASGYDAEARDRIDEDVAGDVVASEAAGGLTGPALLARAFGERVSARTRAVPLVSDEARAWARAEMLRRGRGFVTAVGATNGTPDMVVASRLSLERVGTPFNGGGYYVTRVLHSYDRLDGYRTRFEAERATVNEGV